MKGWFTIPNIKCSGQYEIDLIAINPAGAALERYHIESGISISGAYSKLTSKPFSQKQLHERVQEAGQRRTIGYFVQRKFGAIEVLSQLAKYGFEVGNYAKVIVTWGWTDDAKLEADRGGVILWDFRDLLSDIAKLSRGNKSYFTDDTLRTIQLFEMGNRN
ncbi:MAG: hypothetical protein IIC95_09570 [Chloroflexi bacterium]|nr:hypothetical protein [Chloroflexota bacterium]